MKINGHKVKKIKVVDMDKIDGIKEVKFINPGALVEHMDDMEDLLFLTVLCGSVKDEDIEMSDGTHITSEEAKLLPLIVTSAVLGELGVSGNDLDKFIDDVQAGKNKLFEKYWAKYSEAVKKIAGDK